MQKTLIIVESPTKARTLSRFLGDAYDVEATMGHIKDLPKSKLGIDVENNFKPEYDLVPQRLDSIKNIKKVSKGVNEVLVATDPDREGEAIAQHIVEVVDSKAKPKRIVFHEITENAVRNALETPGKVNPHLVDAQIARRVLDRLVGYKLSPLLWKKVRRGLSAGRVQSVTVKLIVEKEREIDAFKSREYWEFFVELKEKEHGKKLTVQLIKIDDEKAVVSNEKDASNITSDLKKAIYKVGDVKTKEVVRKPLPPFTTSTMSQSAARLYFWSARKTMSVAQALYEEGLITYHRTDSFNLSKQSLLMVRGYIKKKYGDNYLPENPNYYKTKAKVAQEAHEAIRPTKVGRPFKVKNTKFKKDAEKLYLLIWKRFVASQMKPAINDETTILVNAKVGSDNAYELRVSGQIVKFDGWRILYKNDNSNGKDPLPQVKTDDLLDLIKVNPEQKFTQPPARYSEASLIKTLEKLGIGRPSTYAPIITTIQIRNYVEKREGRFKPTPVGFSVNDFLIGNFPKVFGYTFTAEMETDLDDIAQGKGKWQEMMSEFYKPFEKKLISVEKNAKRVEIKTEKVGKKCPKCKKGDQVIRIGRFGKFISCSNFPDCDFKDKYVERIGMKCPDCIKGDVIIKTTSKRRRFYGCSNYPKCKWASWRKPIKNPDKS